MGRLFPTEYLILIRAQCPYDSDWKNILEEKHRETEKELGAFWYYRGNTTRPEQVRRFIKNHGTVAKFTFGFGPEEFLAVTPPVLIYFPNPLDYYKQSLNVKVTIHHDDSAPITYIRHAAYDWPGQNVLIVGNIESIEKRCTVTPSFGTALNLSTYEIAVGARKGMCARKYFVDGKYGQRIACLRRTQTSEPAHYVRIDARASLVKPFASRCTRW